MRILKYIFLLLLLIFIGISVFVATQKGEYDIVKTKVVNIPKSVVFTYVNDYRNWETWVAWDKSDVKFKFPSLTSGKGGSFSWEGNLEEGSSKTSFVKENDSIVQKMIVGGLPSDLYWTFKDTFGGTKVTWRINGKMGFLPKISAFFKGGVDTVMGKMYEESLENLDKTLDYEMNTYTIKVDGIVQMPAKYYMYQNIRSTIANMPKNMRIMMSKVHFFFTKNKIRTAGKPFILYKSYDIPKGITEFSVCIPVTEEIFTSPGSDILSGKLEGFRAVKITVRGDYSHLKEAWKKMDGHISISNLEKNKSLPSMELYAVGSESEKHPSKWVTEIYTPLLPEINKTDTTVSSPSQTIEETIPE